MDISLFGLLRTYAFQIPNILTNSCLALIGCSPNASVQDALTEFIVSAGRPILNKPAAILKSQIQCKADPGVWGSMWIAKCIIPASELPTEKHTGVCDVRTGLLKAIDHLGDGSNKYTAPAVVDVEAEWTGFRNGVSKIAPRPNLSERKQYQHMMKEVAPDSPTILYFHGGAFCLMDPSTHRLTTSSLAEKTHGRCLSVRYRLAPQNAFPAALLDGLIAYLSLLHPPPEALHEPVSASQIILAGDSSGANIATSLMLLLLTLPQIGITHLYFHGQVVPMSRPGGLAITSPWLDVSRSLPSISRNIRYDILAPPSTDLSVPHPKFPPDSIWPASPPRVETYCNANMVSHPLVSPLAAHAELWRGVPPVYISVGWESMQDESEVLARRIYEIGGMVMFDGYVGMPHAFSVLPWNKAGRRAMSNWAMFCHNAVRGVVKSSDTGSWFDKHEKIRVIKLKDLGMKDEECGRTSSLTDGIVDIMMTEQRVWRVQLEEELRRKWKESLH